MGTDRGVAEGNSLETLGGDECFNLVLKAGRVAYVYLSESLNCTLKICVFHTQLILIHGVCICENTYSLTFICNPKMIHVLSGSFLALSMHRLGENLSHLAQVPS